MKLFGFLFLVPFVLATDDDNSVGNENCMAQTDAGRVQCILQKSPRKRYEVEYYPCIPYAKPVARFGNPEPLDRDPTRQLNRENCPVCLQPDGNSTRGSEDCLSLNVFVPRKCSDKKLLPVVVVFPAGAFYLGNAPKQQSYLLDECVVVVTVNYRLGPLGFLSLYTPQCPGNAGLKDALAALEWVNANIESLGGDPNKVTISGIGAGGVINTYLLMNPKACNLFNNAIVEGGVALNSWAFTSKSRVLRKGFDLGRQFGCTGTEEEVCQCLINVPADLLIQKGRYDQINPKEELWAPAVGIPDFPEGFITDHPRNLVVKQENLCKPKNIMIGNTKDESCLFRPMAGKYSNLLSSLSAVSSQAAVRCLAEGTNPQCQKYITEEMNKFYTGETNVYDSNNIWRPLSMISFFLDTMALVNLLAEYGYNVYLSEFAYSGKCRPSKMYHTNGEDVCHGDQFLYEYVQEPMTTLCFENQREGNEEVEFSKLYNQLQGQFIKTGSPTPITSRSGLEWPRWTNQTQLYLEIDSKPTVGQGLHNDDLAFWKRMIEKCDVEDHGLPNQCCSVCSPKYTYPAL